MARPFIWTQQKERAVALEYEGVSQGEIAEHLGTTRRTVEGWARRREFRARLAALRAQGHRRFDAEWAEQLRAIREGAAGDVAEEADDTAHANAPTPHARVEGEAARPTLVQDVSAPTTSRPAEAVPEDASVDQLEHQARLARMLHGLGDIRYR
jgi:Helix-turn-helix domain